MNSSLLGIELVGDRAVLTVVERSGSVSAAIDEPLDGRVENWWETHPEERYRAILALLERALRRGLFAGGKIAAIGMTCSHGLVLLDPDFEAMTELPWSPLLDGTDKSPATALAQLVEQEPGLARRIGTVMSTLDFLRYRLTGALATHAGFAYSIGLVRPDSVDVWDHGAIEGLGVSVSAFPPIFRAPERVGIVGEDVVARSGISRGVWINAGSDPTSARILVAGEPRHGAAVALASSESAELWRIGNAPGKDDSGNWDRSALPLADLDLWANRDSEGGTVNGDGSTIIDWDAEEHPKWLHDVADEDGVTVAFDAGGPSAGAAIQAGIGLGWWRDLRTLWRKKRGPRTLAEFEACRVSEESSDSHG